MLDKIRALLHDMNNKLTPIAGNASLLASKSCPACPNAIYSKRILAASKVMDEMIAVQRRELLLCSIREAPPYPLGKMLRNELSDYIKEQGHIHGIDIEVDIHVTEGCMAVGSTDHDSNGKSIIRNCIVNAQNANAKSMRIVWVEAKHYITAHFIDDGDGMDEEQVEMAGIERKGHEGMIIIKRLAYEMGGTVNWTSAGVGAGATVSVRVPKYTPEEEAA